MSNNEYIVHNEVEMQDLANRFLQMLDNMTHNTGGVVLALSGELGAGKTTFTKALAIELGITEPVTSPTFVIQKSYNVSDRSDIKKLVHIDAYRLESGADAEVLGLAETISTNGNLVVIEWAENIKSALPSGVINIKFEYISNTTRRITINGTM
jgi:tRNA threonylcarbamoyladenosine biosynthesis protein TsaE